MTMQDALPTTTKEPKNAKDLKKAAPASDPPEGFERRTTDVTGFYDGESTLRVIPIEVKAFDGNQDDSKPSCLIIAKLAQAANLRSKDNDGNEITVKAKTGDMVGIWYKPGMRDIVDCGGVEVFIRPGGEKDVGKQQPMKVFEIYTRGSQKGTPLLVTTDQRAESRDVNLPFKLSADAKAEDTTTDNVPY